jgi:penicillin amidase
MADLHGTIGYLTRGKVPQRSRSNGWLPVPGWTGDHEWEGDIPFEDMPRLRNPDRGYLVTANNRIVGADYPYYLALNYAPPYRAKRIIDRLAALDLSTPDDMARIHSDRLSLPGCFFINRIKKIRIEDETMAETSAETLAEALKHLEHWDGEMDPDSTGAVIYIVTRDQLTRMLMTGTSLNRMTNNTFPDEPSVPGINPEDWLVWGAIPAMLDMEDASLLGTEEKWSHLLVEALNRALTWLMENLGPDMNKWKWGILHRTVPTHPLSPVYPEFAELLNPRSVSIGGDGDTPQAAAIAPCVSYNVVLTSVARYIFDLADWDNSRWVVPLGSSGHPGSSHYDDQAKMWSEIQYIPMVYSWEKIIPQAETNQLLEPN